MNSIENNTKLEASGSGAPAATAAAAVDTTKPSFIEIKYQGRTYTIPAYVADCCDTRRELIEYIKECQGLEDYDDFSDSRPQPDDLYQ